MPKKIFWNHWIWLAVGVVMLDQLSKYWAATHLAEGQGITLLPVLSLSLAFNPGAGFSFFSNGHAWQIYGLMLLSLLASLVLLVWLLRTPVYRSWYSAALALLLGGAVGNLIDRLRFHFVVDFISIHCRDWYFPTFNVADMSVTFGAILLFGLLMFQDQKR